MEMDKLPLNRAHQLERKAELLNRQKKYDAAIECHEEAIEQFKLCLATGFNKIITESIQLQKDWNERQIRLLELKKAHLKKKANGCSSLKTSYKETENLETKIFRAMETHDSLIDYLSNRGTSNENRQVYSTIEEEEDNDAVHFVGNKHPKDDSTIIEELKVLCGELRESVQGLLIQLDDRNKEIEELKANIKEIEKSSPKDDGKSNLQIIDSSGGTSPYAFSPLTELSPDVLELPELPSLPSLDLVPLPEFDISRLRQFSVPEVSSRLLRRD